MSNVHLRTLIVRNDYNFHFIFLFFDFNILINNNILSLARSVFTKVQRPLTKKNQKTNQKIYQTINGGTKP